MVPSERPDPPSIASVATASLEITLPESATAGRDVQPDPPVIPDLVAVRPAANRSPPCTRAGTSARDPEKTMSLQLWINALVARMTREVSVRPRLLRHRVARYLDPAEPSFLLYVRSAVRQTTVTILPPRDGCRVRPEQRGFTDPHAAGSANSMCRVLGGLCRAYPGTERTRLCTGLPLSVHCSDVARDAQGPYRLPSMRSASGNPARPCGTAREISATAETRV